MFSTSRKVPAGTAAHTGRAAFSQITMSEKLRISTRAYGNLERGQACCSAQTLIRLLAMMQMPEAYTLIRKLDDAFREQENQEPENAA